MTPNALHSKKTPNWGTPQRMIDLGRKLLDDKIDLDPASSELFNSLVKADAIYTAETNGLAQIWAGHVFLNPPGGLVKDFWVKLMQSIQAGYVPKAFWVGFSVEQLCTLADLEFHPLDFSTCILRKRLCFTSADLNTGGAPSHGNYVTGLGVDRDLFDKLFAEHGKIVHGPLV